MSSNDPEGSLPISSALAEAEVESISELFSRDPEGYSRQNRDVIVANFQRMAEKWEILEAEGRKIKQPRTDKKNLLSESPKSLEDLGL